MHPKARRHGVQGHRQARAKVPLLEESCVSASVSETPADVLGRVRAYAMSGLRWVLNTYQVAQDWDAETLCRMARETGHEGVEFLQDYHQPHGLEADATAEQRQRVRTALAAHGLECASLTSCMHFDMPDPAARRRSEDQVRRVIAYAPEMGCRHVRVLGDRLPEAPAERAATLAAVAESLHALGEFAVPAGITVSLEVHGSFSDPEPAREVVRAAALDNVGLVFNSQWRVGASSGFTLPAGAASIRPLYDHIGQWFTSVHTHDLAAPAETPYYRELFGLLRAAGWQGFVSNECAYRGPDPDRVLRLYTALFRALTA